VNGHGGTGSATRPSAPTPRSPGLDRPRMPVLHRFGVPGLAAGHSRPPGPGLVRSHLDAVPLPAPAAACRRWVGPAQGAEEDAGVLARRVRAAPARRPALTDPHPAEAHQAGPPPLPWAAATWTYSQPTPVTANAGGVGDGAVVVLAESVRPAFAGPALGPAELLHVDVDELAWPRVLVPDSWLEPDPAEPPDPAPAPHRRDGRARHQQRLGDLGRGHPQPAERNDHGDAIRRGAVVDRRGADDRSAKPASPSTR